MRLKRQSNENAGRKFEIDISGKNKYIKTKAGIAQLVEYKLPKLGVAGSNPVARSSPGAETVGA